MSISTSVSSSGTRVSGDGQNQRREARSTAGHSYTELEHSARSSTIATEIVEIFRKIVLFPVKSAFIPFVKESKTQEKKGALEARKRALETSLGGTVVSLKTSSQMPITAMHFSASAERCASLQASSQIQTRVPAPISASGPTVILCTGSDCSVFEIHYEHMIRAYLARGVNVVIYDYPGVGLSGGSFSVKNSYEAAEAVFQHLRRAKNVPEDKIVVEGFSMGSGPASSLAKKHNNIHLILRFPFVRISEIGVECIGRGVIGAHSKLRSLYRNTLGAILERVIRFGLPFDVKENMQKFTGDLGVMISGAKDMFDEELQTEKRLTERRDRTRVVSVTIPEAWHMTSYFDTAVEVSPGSRNMSAVLDSMLEKFSITIRIP